MTISNPQPSAEQIEKLNSLVDWDKIAAEFMKKFEPLVRDAVDAAQFDITQDMGSNAAWDVAREATKMAAELVDKAIMGDADAFTQIIGAGDYAMKWRDAVRIYDGKVTVVDAVSFRRALLQRHAELFTSIVLTDWHKQEAKMTDEIRRLAVQCRDDVRQRIADALPKEVADKYRDPAASAWDMPDLVGCVIHVVQERQAMQEELRALRPLRRVLAALVNEVTNLCADSNGVMGYHQNGDVAPWSELLKGGQYECLATLDDAREALQQAPVDPVEMRLQQIESALQRAFPHFQENRPVDVETIQIAGDEHVRMITEWEPQKTQIEFVDQAGQERVIHYESGDCGAGIKGGWTIPEDATWECVDLVPSADA